MVPMQFSDFEPYCDMIANADLRMRVLGLEKAQYSIIQAPVAQLGLQWAQEGSGQLTEGVTDRNAFGFFMHLDPRPMLVNGMSVDPEAIVFFPPGSEFRNACTHANSWFSIRVPMETLVETDGEGAPELLDSVSVVQPKPGLARQLRTIVPKYLSALCSTPSLAESTLANERLQEQVIAIARQVCVRSAANSVESHSTSKRVDSHHEWIATKAADLIENSLDHSQSVAGIARALQVSERTLLTAFRSRLGTSPRQFIQSMRLNRARALLRRGDYPETLVQEIAAKCGFWDFGRFAAKYKRLFGEYPSETALKATS